jgi:hypothetical protein
MGTSRDRSYLGQLLILKKSFWIPIEEDLRNFFLQLVFFYSACGPRKAMHSERANSKFPDFFPFSITIISQTVGDRNPVFAPLNPP